jgi:NTP pyrophosphatase (non-canonical NTP hydrolase)
MKAIISEVCEEILRAEKKFPGWPVDPVHGAAIVAEEAGEALQAALDYYYGRADERALRKELLHTAAMAMRFLKNFDISILAQKHRK